MSNVEVRFFGCAPSFAKATEGRQGKQGRPFDKLRTGMGESQITRAMSRRSMLIMTAVKVIFDHFVYLA